MALGFDLISFRIIWKYFSPFIVVTAGNSVGTYENKIRFILTFSPKQLTNLFLEGGSRIVVFLD